MEKLIKTVHIRELREKSPPPCHYFYLYIREINASLFKNRPRFQALGATASAACVRPVIFCADHLGVDGTNRLAELGLKLAQVGFYRLGIDKGMRHGSWTLSFWLGLGARQNTLAHGLYGCFYACEQCTADDAVTDVEFS